MQLENMDSAFGGAANKVELGAWLRISRNNVDTFMDELGILALGRKYPWRRIAEGVLGIEVSVVSNLADAPMMTLAEAAEEIGQPVDSLKAKVQNGELLLPPLYVFGQKRNRFIRSQIIDYSRSPRNTFSDIPLQKDLFLMQREVAAKMECSLQDLEAAFESGEFTEPKHVVLTGGAKWYFKSDLERIRTALRDNQETYEQTLALVFSGGLLGSVAKSFAHSVPV